jgi:hypothetical protein
VLTVYAFWIESVECVITITAIQLVKPRPAPLATTWIPGSPPRGGDTPGCLAVDHMPWDLSQIFNLPQTLTTPLLLRKCSVLGR